MDPRKLSPQELVQLCLDSKDEAIWTEFVRRFQPLIAGVMNQTHFFLRDIKPNHCLGKGGQPTARLMGLNNFSRLRVLDFCRIESIVHTNQLVGQSNPRKAAGIAMLWNL